jgi:hypothetical protein
MKLTTKQKLLIMQYVLDNISFEGLDYPETNCDNVTMLRDSIINEMGATKQRQGLNCTSDYYYVAKLTDFLQGLPSYLSIEFSNFKIIELGKQWGIDLTTEDQQDEWLQQYWIAIAHAIHNLTSLK